jgi:hypothetical protein
MKVSEFLRHYQITGKVPDAKDPAVAFWAGWLMGGKTRLEVSLAQDIEMAAKAAEFIEEHAKG